MRFAAGRRRLIEVLGGRRVARAVAVGMLATVATVAACTDAPAPDRPPAPPSSTATPSPASTVARSSAPTTATPSQTATSTGAPVLPPLAGRRWVRYECTYAAESLQGRVTTDAITYQTAQNFFSLQIAAISQVNVSFCYRVHVVCSVQLAGGIDHGRTRN